MAPRIMTNCNWVIHKDKGNSESKPTGSQRLQTIGQMIKRPLRYSFIRKRSERSKRKGKGTKTITASHLILIYPQINKNSWHLPSYEVAMRSSLLIWCPSLLLSLIIELTTCLLLDETNIVELKSITITNNIL